MSRRIFFVYNTARYLYNMRRELVAALQERDFDVTAVVPNDDAVERLRSMGVRWEELPIAAHGTDVSEDWRTYRHLLGLFRAQKPDAVFCFTVKPAIYGSLAASRANIERIFSMITGLGYAFSSDTLRQRLLGRIVSAMYRVALRRNDVVFFQNTHDRDLFVRKGLVDGSRAVVVDGSGVDLRYFTPAGGTPERAVFILIARLRRDKGVAEYAQAARMLKRRYAEAEFLLLGPFDGSANALTPEQIEAWEGEGILRYLGVTDDVRPYLSRASVFVLPSYYREGVPRAILEAMAMGRPVVATDWPGCRDAVADGETGFLVPVRNPTALAAAMERFIREPALAARMGARARAAAARYDVRRINERILGAMRISDAL